MNNKTTLLFGIHLHQPIDNFKWVIDHAVKVCYEPFFEVMSRYPEFRFSVHCSGWLMEQIENDFPSLYKKIKKLSDNGSIEFFSAGYYEPILSVIPSNDRVAQINRLNNSINKQFNQNPNGLWLTERVWESSLIPDLKKSNIKYTVMDDYHFQCAGFDEDILDGYYMTEEGGDRLGLFPISKKLRYALPFLSVKSAIDAIKSYNKKENSCAIIFDDAEKFGMWPHTYEWVYEKGWLEEFVQTVLSDKSIKTEHYGEYFSSQKPRGITYLPNVSYYEMGEWSLRADDAKNLEQFKKEMGLERYEKEGVKFLKGGIWKNFFVKYPESNRLHKRMVELSKVNSTLNNPDFTTLLYKFQTNDALWHGVFGGLYLPNLRDNAYNFLIQAEKIRYNQKSIIEIDDNEMDGFNKIKAVTPNFIFRFDEANGGQMIEFDVFENNFNWQNTLTRRKELYHQKILEPEEEIIEDDTPIDGIDTIHSAVLEIDDDMKNAVIYDWYMKNSFIDHISDNSFNIYNFRNCNFKEFGDFANQPFESKVEDNNIIFNRDGGLYDDKKYSSTLIKQYTPEDNGFLFDIKFDTTMNRDLIYILELNLHFADYDEVDISKDKNILKIVDKFTKKIISIYINSDFELYTYPLDTISQSEKGFDLTTQAISIGLAIPFKLKFNIQGQLKVENV